MEIIRNRVDSRLCTQAKQIEKLIVKPNFIHRTIYTENLVAVHMAKTNLTFNKPIYVGMSIHFYMIFTTYNTMKDIYNDDIKLLYTDTGSLINTIKNRKLLRGYEKYDRI